MRSVYDVCGCVGKATKRPAAASDMPLQRPATLTLRTGPSHDSARDTRRFGHSPKARWFTELDVIAAFYKIRIKEGDN